MRIRDDDMPFARFAIAFKGASWNDVDSLTLMVMQVGSLHTHYVHSFFFLKEKN